MERINKLEILKTLVNDDNYVHMSGESAIIRHAFRNESWLTAAPEVKQSKRNEFLALSKRRKTIINLEYYEKMILVYDLLLDMLTKLEQLVNSEKLEGKSVSMPLLRITALVLVEQDFIDEYILPSHHIQPHYFQNISNELHNEYPDLKLDEFAELYTEMYNLWPEKTKYEINKT